MNQFLQESRVVGRLRYRPQSWHTISGPLWWCWLWWLCSHFLVRSLFVLWHCNHGHYNEVLFIAFITSCSATISNSIFISMESSEPIRHLSQSVIVTTNIFCSHLKPLYFRSQWLPYLLLGHLPGARRLIANIAEAPNSSEHRALY